MRTALLWLALLLTITGSTLARPNLIVIYTDDHGWPDLGCQGIYEDLKTPHLDALAASGVRATNGYSTAPQCVPSRAGLLAGRHQSRFGVESNASTLEGFEAQITIAERLQAAGFVTAQFGKWHLGPSTAIPEHGFTYTYSKNANRPCHANLTLGGQPAEMGLVDDGLYHIDACTEAAVGLIKARSKDPLFLYIAYRAPHVPLDAPRRYLDRFPGEMPERRRQALAMIAAMDDGVGRIVETLKAKGLLENTLLFFIGDNGAPLKITKTDAPGGGPGWDGSLNEPMNGEKGMLSEGGIRVPFLISWPGTIPAGQVFEHPVSSLDVAASACALAGLGVPEGELDGVDLLPFLTGEAKGAPHESIAWRWISQAALREGNWKLLVGGDRHYLYDLATDPGEATNLLAAKPEIAERLREKLRAWCGELVDPGLPEGSMSEVWDRYFDHYLEGKAITGDLRKPKGQPATAEWIARGATLTEAGGQLTVRADPKAKRAFLVRSGLQLQGPITAEIRFAQIGAGSVGVAWRSQGDKDFLPGKIATTKSRPIEGPQTITIKAPASDAIHLRILLPEGDAVIDRIVLRHADGKLVSEFGAP